MSENIPSSGKALNVFVQPGDGSKNNQWNQYMEILKPDPVLNASLPRYAKCEVLGDDFGLVISRGD